MKIFAQQPCKCVQCCRKFVLINGTYYQDLLTVYNVRTVQSVPLSIHKIAHAPFCDYLLQEIKKCGYGASSSAGTSDLPLVSGTCNKKTILIPSLAMLQYKAKQNVKEIFPPLHRIIYRYFYHRICRNRNNSDDVPAYIAMDFFFFNFNDKRT